MPVKSYLPRHSVFTSVYCIATGMCAGLHDPPSALFDRYTFLPLHVFPRQLVRRFAGVWGMYNSNLTYSNVCPTKFPALHWGTQPFNSLRRIFTFFQLGKNGWFGVRGAFPYFVWLKLGPLPYHSLIT